MAKRVLWRPAMLFGLACTGLGWFAAGSAHATAGMPTPPPTPPASAPVVDQSHLLSASTVRQLDAELGADNGSAKAQMAVAIVSCSTDFPIAAYAESVFNAWGVGHAGRNDGVLLVVDAGSCQVRIQTGTGLAATLPHGVVQSIIDNDMLPDFRAGQPDRAVLGGVAALRGDLDLPSAPSGGGGSWAVVAGWVAAGIAAVGFGAWMVRRAHPPRRRPEHRRLVGRGWFEGWRRHRRLRWRHIEWRRRDRQLVARSRRGVRSCSASSPCCSRLGGQPSRARMSSAPSTPDSKPPASTTLAKRAAFFCFNAITFSSMVPLATRR